MESNRSTLDETSKQRRRILMSAGLSPALLLPHVFTEASQEHARRSRIKLSCNLYSFNSPLRNRQMTLEQVIEFCADAGFEAVDPTGYYFPNYPDLPDDDYVYRIKRRAFRLGLDISGTGVRNDFTLEDPTQRKKEVELVKRWTALSAKLGAPVLRVFSGRALPAGKAREDAHRWLVESLRECADYASKYGVIIVLQNHADFVETADHVLNIVKDVNSEWFAINLDIGSFRSGDSYAEIARVVPHAATWQIKENLYMDGKETKTDVKRVARIARDAGYRGYFPIETLGAGDPKEKVPRFLEEVKAALASVG